MDKQHKGLVGTILGFVSGMRFPWLFGLVALLFGIDVLLPDVFPLVDELLLGLLTLLLAAWRKRKNERSGIVEGRKACDTLPAPIVQNASPGNDD